MIYLARTVLDNPVRYSLRLSYWSTEHKQFRTSLLMELGTQPGEFIYYPNDSSFQLDLDLVFQMEKKCGSDIEPELERLLWPFVNPSVQRKMEHFFYRGKSGRKYNKKMTLISCDGLQSHSFDKRRLHFLRFGSTDQGEPFLMPPRLEAKLLNRSRDELEQYFYKEEAKLREVELKSYLYASLNLQSRFTETYARTIPQALPPEKIEQVFIDALCELNDDRSFWQERNDYGKLPDYLIRYLILFFDSSFPRNSMNSGKADDFMNDHRQFRWPQRKSSFSDDEVEKLFGQSTEKLKNIDKKELTRLYRQKAKSLHPDTGGNHEEFVRLTDAYEELLRKIR